MVSAAHGSPAPGADRPLILLTGASGYVGGRLLDRLETEGARLRCMTRRPEELEGRVARGTEVVRGDVTDPGSLEGALAGVEIAYYLVHSMTSGTDYSDADRRGAAAFAEAARTAGVGRIVYLGGLGHGEDLSPHLASRQEVGRILAASGVPTLELRASIVIGSGSTSFEMIRALVDRLPVMVTPRWVGTLTQPIAIEDVLAYLAEAARVPLSESRIVEIGGPDRVSYRELMRLYARRRGLRRVMVPVPVLTPWLSSLWLGLVTPVYARVGRELVEGLRNETVVRDPSAASLFSVRPRGARDAIDRALANEDREFASTRWSDALSSGPAARAFGGEAVGSRLVRLALGARHGPSGGRLRAHPAHRRRPGLVLRRPALAPERAARPALRGSRGAARPAPPRPAAPGRHGGLLARGGHRGRPSPAPGGRDDPARTRLAAVRGRAGGRRLDHPPDRDLRPGGPRRPALLVFASGPSTASSSAAWSAASRGRPVRPGSRAAETVAR